MTRRKDRYQPRVPSASQPKTLKTYSTVAFARLPQPFGPALFVTHGTFARSQQCSTSAAFEESRILSATGHLTL
jgi:hypothetical protein